jgi:DNA-binding CsgD family transcriptional regulator
VSTDLRQLSDREIEILRLVSGGLSNQQIALQLGISANTVKVHLRNIFGKIGAASRTEATLYAVRTGLVTVGNGTPAIADEPLDPVASESADQAQALSSLILDEPPTEQMPSAEIQATASTTVPAPVEDDTDIPSATPTERAAAESDTVATMIATSRVQDTLTFRWLMLLVVGLAVIGGTVSVLWINGRTGTATPSPTGIAATTTNAESSRWKELPPATEARAAFAIATVNDVIYAIGGENEGGILASVARFDPQFATWTPLSNKPTAVADVHAVVLGGRIYVPGGRLSADSVNISRAFERYDPRTETWEALPPLPQPRSAYALAALEGKLYIFGGWDGAAYRAEVFEYDPDANRWRERTAMPTARAFAGAAVVENSVYVLGGENDSGKLNNNEAYSPAQEGAQPWTRHAPMPAAQSHFGAAAALTIIHTIGGTTGDTQPLKYNVRTDSWQSFTASPIPVGRQPGVVLLETSIVSLGGMPSANTYANQMQSYQALFTTVLP